MQNSLESIYPLAAVPVPAADRDNDPLEEKTVSTSVLLDGNFVKVKRDEVALPDGSGSFRVYLMHPGAAGMVALYEDGTILLERQWRHSLKKSFWEIPAGKLDADESELECAKRELVEECGVRAKRWTKLGTMNNAIGYSAERIVVFLAEDLEEGAQALDPGEFLEVWRVPAAEALAMARDGRITDVKTIAALFWLEALLRGRRSGRCGS